MKNWKTSLSGILAAVGLALSQTDIGGIAGGIVAVIGLVLLSIFSSDSSTVDKVADRVRDKIGLFLVAMLCLMALAPSNLHAKDHLMREQIEPAVIAKLKADFTLPASAVQNNRGTAAKVALATPNVQAFIDAGAYKAMNVSKTVWRSTVKVYVFLQVQRLRDEERFRRQAVYPFLDLALTSLTGEKLGLDIAPLEPVRDQNVSTEADDKAGVMTWLLEFSTHHEWRKLDADATAPLLKMAFDYLLEPGDDEVDMVSERVDQA